MPVLLIALVRENSLNRVAFFNVNIWLTVAFRITLRSLVLQANSIILGMVVKEILRLNHPTTGDDTKYQSARYSE